MKDMSSVPHILLIEDDPVFLKVTSSTLTRNGFMVTGLTDAEEALKTVKQLEPDLIITDFRLGGISGIEFIHEVRQIDPQLLIIVTTGFGDDQVAIQAIKEGAFDYLLKPFETEELVTLIQRALETKSSLKLNRDIQPAAIPHALIGKSRPMQTVFKEIGRVAAKKITVLIRGESGTGKELVARALHQHSDRADKPLVEVNCVAIPETLLESELFGHERGAFTDAYTRRIGRFEQAHGGTIFLDEIGDMSLATQSKLLRVLQESSFQRLGGKEDIKLDVRIIAATNRDLESAIEKKLFRQDLFYRLSVVDINLPPLRQRQDDIPDLIHYFISKHSADLGYESSTITQEGLKFLQQQTWPGNVRELENLVRKAILHAREQPITLSMLVNLYTKAPTSAPPSGNSVSEIISHMLAEAASHRLANVRGLIDEKVERELYGQAIALARGNQRKAAAWLGVSRPTMKEKLVKYSLYHDLRQEDMSEP